jgi:diguanylate cyclase
MNLDLSRTSRTRVILVTVLGTLACVAITFLVDTSNLLALDAAARTRALVVDTVLPVGLAAPLLYYFMSKLRELAIAHERLQAYASTDSLTAVLNRGAFITLVEAYLDEVRTAERETKGALLIVDADNFKTVNDTLGHDAGDRALKVIATAIKGALRNIDLVGRIGGEEFAIFLPGSTVPNAETVAERIRQTIYRSTFEAMPEGRHLSVSIGGAVFERRVDYPDLFRIADQQLYRSKQNGRNRVTVSPITSHHGIPAAAA